MEISNIKLVKPFGPLVMMAELPETVIKSCNEIVDVIKDRKDMGSRLAGQIKSESEIPHSMLEQKNVMNVLHTVGKSYVGQAYLNAGKKDLYDAVKITTQMKSIWSVSQYENEYNPQHNHSNCQISAVMYLKVPTMKPRSIAFNMSYKAFDKVNGIQIAGDSVNLYNETNYEESIPHVRLDNV